VAAAIGTLLMAFLATTRSLAPGMGLNAFFAFTVVLGMKFTWQVALGCVFISGVIFLILSVLPVREWIVNAIPKSLKMAIAAGIGLFLALIALQGAEILVSHPATLITAGDLKSWPVILAALGFVLIAALEYLGAGRRDHRRARHDHRLGAAGRQQVRGRGLDAAQHRAVTCRWISPAPSMWTDTVVFASCSSISSTIREP
jgi:hypothetical protein